MPATHRWGVWLVALGVGVLCRLPASGGEPDPQACVDCHVELTPSIVGQWRGSSHAKACPRKTEVTCFSCHEARAGDPDAHAWLKGMTKEELDKADKAYRGE